jgi:hypothetical protein
VNLRLPQVVALTIGGLLIFSAVRNVSALDVIKAAITGSPMPVGGSTGGFTDSDGNYHPNIPGYLGGGTTTAPGSGSNSNPNYVPYDPPPTGQHNPQYDNNGPNGQLETYVQPYSVPYQVTSV